MNMWDMATSNQGGRGLTTFVGTMNCFYFFILSICYFIFYVTVNIFQVASFARRINIYIVICLDFEKKILNFENFITKKKKTHMSCRST